MKIDRLVYRVRKLLHGEVYAARAAGVRIGKNCRILSSPITSEPWTVKIGDRVTVSGGVTFVTHDGSGWLHHDANGARAYSYGPIEIGNDVFIGTRAIIMPGVSIGDRCIVGAGSVVTASVPPGSVVAGNPARYISSWEDNMAKKVEWFHGRTDRSDASAYRAFVAKATMKLPLPPVKPRQDRFPQAEL